MPICVDHIATQTQHVHNHEACCQQRRTTCCPSNELRLYPIRPYGRPRLPCSIHLNQTADIWILFSMHAVAAVSDIRMKVWVLIRGLCDRACTDRVLGCACDVNTMWQQLCFDSFIRLSSDGHVALLLSSLTTFLRFLRFFSVFF
jgi:hypothetical protein